MKNERKFFECSHCKNIISFLHDAGPSVTCCGEEMQALTPNTTDGAKEKHIPLAVREGNKLTVTVGSVPHPMTEEHHIAWIVVVDGNMTQRFALEKTQEPTAEFVVSNNPVTVYEYCNLHGLWAAESL
ncbi:MAG: desulfoferrodoxin [Treponema sp.]|nr:desulfoferrodoxin [Treponema sp.]